MHSLLEVMQSFVDGRLQEKLGTLREDDPKRLSTAQEYQLETWIANAAKRASQIKLVTHAVKFHHPDARGSSVCLLGQQVTPAQQWLSSKALKTPVLDVVGNAAALDVFKFLQISYEGETLLSRILRQDPLVYEAFPGSADQKKEWFEAFSAINQPESKFSSHTFAKQLYFPVAPGQYHIISPLYPTVLVQALFDKVQERFGEEVKLAKEARRLQKVHPEGYRETVDLAVQKFGGTKPQNISQLNSVRRGQSFLVASLPPLWKKQTIKPPLRSKSWFPSLRYGEVGSSVQYLRDYLARLSEEVRTHEVRAARQEAVQEIIDVTLQKAAFIQQLPSGWSLQEECRLSLEQKRWLDPHCSEWQAQCASIDWQDKVASEFAQWLNQQLRTKTMTLGDEEYYEWKKSFEKQLRWLEEE